MRSLLNLIFFLLLMLFACNQPEKNIYKSDVKDDYNVKIRVPDAWIEKVRAFNYNRNTQTLIKEFESIIKPDTLTNPHTQHVKEGYGRVFNPVFVNVDDDTEDELLCLLGWDISCPDLCVFKRIDNNWYLIYLEPVDTFYNSPTLSVANNFSKNKVFYFRQVDGHGSGVYFDSFNFYKLINKKVYKCLHLINKAYSYGPKPYMSQDIKVNFEFSGDESDYLSVGYNYNFFLGDINPIIKTEGGVGYKWDSAKYIYKLDIQPYQNQIDDLTADKIACFENFSDTLFVKAFKRQIDTVLKTGSSLQKIALRQYLDKVEGEHPHSFKPHSVTQ